MIAGWAVRIVVGNVPTWATGEDGRRLVFPSAEAAEEHIESWGPPSPAPSIKVSVQEVDVQEQIEERSAAIAAAKVEPPLPPPNDVARSMRLLRHWTGLLVIFDVLGIAFLAALIKDEAARSYASGRFAASTFGFFAAISFFVSLVFGGLLIAAVPHFLEIHGVGPITTLDRKGRPDFMRLPMLDFWERLTVGHLTALCSGVFALGMFFCVLVIGVLAWSAPNVEPFAPPPTMPIVIPEPAPAPTPTTAP